MDAIITNKINAYSITETSQKRLLNLQQVILGNILVVKEFQLEIRKSVAET